MTPQEQKSEEYATDKFHPAGRRELYRAAFNAYLAGYSSRDEEVNQLRKENEELKEELRNNRRQPIHGEPI